MKIDVNAFIDALPIILWGMAGVFFVVLIIIAAVFLLNLLSSREGRSGNNEKKD